MIWFLLMIACAQAQYLSPPLVLNMTEYQKAFVQISNGDVIPMPMYEIHAPTGANILKLLEWFGYVACIMLSTMSFVYCRKMFENMMTRLNSNLELDRI